MSNWGALLSQNRCKAIGVPWSDKELYAIYQLKIPADFVRNGCLTLEEYQKVSAELNDMDSQGKERPLIHLKKDELMEKAGKLGIQCTPEATRAGLIHLISIEQAKLLKE